MWKKGARKKVGQWEREGRREGGRRTERYNLVECTAFCLLIFSIVFNLNLTKNSVYKAEKRELLLLKYVCEKGGEGIGWTGNGVQRATQ